MKLKKATKKEDFKILEKVSDKRIKEFIKSKSKDFKRLKEMIKKDFERKGFEYSSFFGELLTKEIIEYNRERDYYEKEDRFVIWELGYRICGHTPPAYFPFGEKNCTQSSVEIYMKKKEVPVKMWRKPEE